MAGQNYTVALKIKKAAFAGGPPNYVKTLNSGFFSLG